jgi:hypothetical protein
MWHVPHFARVYGSDLLQILDFVANLPRENAGDWYRESGGKVSNNNPIGTGFCTVGQRYFEGKVNFQSESSLITFVSKPIDAFHNNPLDPTVG